MATSIYEQQLAGTYGSGFTDYANEQRALGKRGVLKGSTLDPQDIAGATQGFMSSSYYKPATSSVIPSMEQLGSQTFQFDPNQHLPGIQETASSIYNPQQAQIDALAKLQTSQTEQKRITTKEDFAKRMNQEVEAINARGAFFGGGALDRQSNIAKDETTALTDINLQDQASQAGFLAQKAGLNAQQAQYVQEKLSGTENSAYSRYQDNRNFLLSLSQEQRRRLESDRQFIQDLTEFGLNYALEKKRAEASKKEDGNKTITYAYTGLPTNKTVDMNYNMGGGTGGSNGGTYKGINLDEL